MLQFSFEDVAYQGRTKKTRNQRFLEQMDAVLPWKAFLSELEPFYPQGAKGRPPVGLDTMLRIYFMQQWFGHSDPGMEDALHDNIAMRRFARLEAGYACRKRKEKAESQGVAWRVLRKAAKGRKLTCADASFNRKSNRTRARVEHPFGVVKHLWGYRKTRYRGLRKNAAQVYTLFALANFYMARKKLTAVAGQVCPSAPF